MLSLEHNRQAIKQINTVQFYSLSRYVFQLFLNLPQE